jgi:hypothetical protein
MEKNVGKTDKLFRYILAVVFFSMGILFHWGFYILGLVMVVTGYIGFCGLYKLFGISTCKIK